MMDDHLNEQNSRELADRMSHLHNPPPETPRERMWDRIDEARRERRGVVNPDFRSHRRSGPMWRMASVAAAVLVLGIGIGRMTGPAPRSIPVVIDSETPGPGGSDTLSEKPRFEVSDQIYQLAAVDLFTRADVLLTDVKVRSCTSLDLGEIPSWAGGMLLQTRLLLDSPVAADPKVQGLLEELELVLAQISGLSRANCAREMAWIKDGMKERSTLDRLRVLADSGAPGRAL